MILAVMAVIGILAFRQYPITITGKVKDSSGKPVPFATITAGHLKTTADSAGNFTITCDDKEKYITISAIGYSAKKIKIDNRTTIDVVLKENISRLEDTVAIGYGIADDASDDKYERYAAPSMKVRKSLGNSFNHNSDFNTEEYSNISENGFHRTNDDPLSTFSIDVDAASYSNVRRFLNSNQLPPAGAVRTEEMVNYFKYHYPQPTGKDPFSINTEMSNCPWNKENKLILIGLQGKIIPQDNLPPSNLVFLIDVSGSMFEEDKLPLVKQSMKLLTDQLRENDRISMVVYAGNTGLVLSATSGSEKTKIKTAIDQLEAGGSTAGGAGLQLAYKIAQQNFMEHGNNRIILCTDGDFNVGPSSDDDLVRLIEKERDKGVYLSVLGFGMGNYKDSKMEQLADKGNGNYAYIDGISEARKVLVNEFGGTLFTIAKDVKIQVEFNPEKVAGYRLIGYEDRLLNKEDFNDDKKDAGELGSGHTVTALYEIIPAGVKSKYLKSVDPLKYQQEKISNESASNEILTVKFRYKKPTEETSQLIVHPLMDTEESFDKTSGNFRFAAAVADFSMLLRNSEFKGESTFEQVLHIANNSLGNDEEGYRKEFVSLVKKARTLSDETASNDEKQNDDN